MNLLQVSSSDYVGYAILLIIVLIISIFITRWVFRIDTLVHYMKIQADLLIKIAKYNNVPHAEIYQVLGKTNPSNKPGSTGDFEDTVANIITESGTQQAIGYVMNLKATTLGSARTYVDELIEKRNLTPKKG